MTTTAASKRGSASVDVVVGNVVVGGDVGVVRATVGVVSGRRAFGASSPDEHEVTRTESSTNEYAAEEPKRILDVRRLGVG